MSWPWAKFGRWEFSCRCGCGYNTVDAELMVVLLDLEQEFPGRRITVNSGCRCVSHNERVQKKKNPLYIAFSSISQHLFGRAADIVVEGVDSAVVYAYLVSKYLGKYGIGHYETFTHIDTRTGASWRSG